MIIRELSFQYPYAFYLFLFVPILFLLILTTIRFKDRAKKYFLKNLIHQNNYRNFIYVAWVLIWILATIALMNPRSNLKYLYPKDTKKIIPQDFVLLIDNSASMDVQDAPEGKTRFKYAKEIADEIVRHLNGQNISLYAFTSQAFLIVPATIDYLFTRLMLGELQINEQNLEGTDFFKTFESLKGEFSPARHYNLIILTDGGDNKVEANDKNGINNIIKELPAGNVRIFTIGIGTIQGGFVPDVKPPVTSKLQENVLKDIAKAGRGQYYQANVLDSSNIASHIVKNIQNEKMRQFSPSSAVEMHYDEYYQFFLFLVLILLIFIYFFTIWIYEKKKN